MKMPVRLKEIIISGSIVIFGQFIFGIFHEAGHALACERLNLEYEILLWEPWGVNHEPNFIVWLSGGMFAAIILAILLYIHRKNVAVAVGFLPLLIFQIVSAICEGFHHVWYINNVKRGPYFLGIIMVVVFCAFYASPFFHVRRSDDSKKSDDNGDH